MQGQSPLTGAFYCLLTACLKANSLQASTNHIGVIEMSKIPEGATHHCEDPCAVSTGGVRYYKYEQGQWFYWPEAIEPRGVWKECNRPLKPVSAIQPTWNGPEDGLPPVGLDVEIRLRNTPDWSNWCRAKILFAKDSALVFEWAAEGVAHPVNLEQCEIRPIRTAEQLAAEERERQCLALAKATGLTPGAGRVKAGIALYEAGARMPNDSKFCGNRP